MLLRTPARTFAWMPFVVLLQLVCPGALFADGPEGAPKDEKWVAVRVSTHGVVLATKALRRYGWYWPKGEKFRVRVVPLSPKYQVESVGFGEDGTCLSIRLKDHPIKIVDLTKRVLDAVHRDARLNSPCQHVSAVKVFHDERLDEIAKREVIQRFLLPAESARLLGDGWQEYRPSAPSPQRYAPRFHLLSDEPVRPSRFGVWEDILQGEPVPKNANSPVVRQELHRRYRLSDSSCAVYYKVQSKAGSWLIQYWLYYPFDYGLGGHLHDSEHIFVEIDRLGGSVRRVVGAGHGRWAANAGYHTFDREVPPVKLPLNALVEFGKHATVPDINGDGVFTPGHDSNLYWDASKIWGVRDATGTTDSSLRRYEASMAVPRVGEEFRKILVPVVEDGGESPGRERPQDETKCALLPLPDESRDTNRARGVPPCNEPSKNCALEHVFLNGDYKHPDAIMKPALFPRGYLRVGASHTGGSEATREASDRWGGHLGLGVELQWIRLPVPGRLYGELAVGAVPSVLKGEFEGVRGGVYYERLDTNLVGLFVGLIREADPVSEHGRITQGHGGVLFELPILNRWPSYWGSGMHFTLRAGIKADGRTGVSYDVRVGLGVSYGAKYRKFGIRHNDQSPY